MVGVTLILIYEVRISLPMAFSESKSDYHIFLTDQIKVKQT